MTSDLRDPPPYAFDLYVNTIHAGLNAKWEHVTVSKFTPYIIFETNYVFGNMFDETGLDINSCSGYSITAGAGVYYSLGASIGLSLEFSSNYGRAKWNFDPAVDSINNDFNPGGYMITGGLIFLFMSFDEI